MSRPVYIATRGSALALAQAQGVLALCRARFPDVLFDLRVIKTTGDKLQTASLPPESLTKGLFTKEIEIALLEGEADFAVHSLKDLPTELPTGLGLSAVSPREDVRDVLLYRARDYPPGAQLAEFRSGAVVATSSTRRQAQIQALRPDLRTVPIRGNVGTRMQKLAGQPEFDATVLALAGLKRLGFAVSADGRIDGRDVPPGLLAAILPLEQMLPCVGQAALGFESRLGDEPTARICAALNDPDTFQCVTAERAFLQGMGGGCLSPVAAYGERRGDDLRLRAVSFRDAEVRRAEVQGSPASAAELGREAARRLH